MSFYWSLSQLNEVYFMKKKFKHVSREFDEFQVNQCSYLQAALLVLTCNILPVDYMVEFVLGGVLFFVDYNGKCWYLYFNQEVGGEF